MTRANRNLTTLRGSIRDPYRRQICSRRGTGRRGISSGRHTMTCRGRARQTCSIARTSQRWCQAMPASYQGTGRVQNRGGPLPSRVEAVFLNKMLKDKGRHSTSLRVSSKTRNYSTSRHQWSVRSSAGATTLSQDQTWTTQFGLQPHDSVTSHQWPETGRRKERGRQLQELWASPIYSSTEACKTTTNRRPRPAGMLATLIYSMELTGRNTPSRGLILSSSIPHTGRLTWNQKQVLTWSDSSLKIRKRKTVELLKFWNGLFWTRFAL